MIIQNQGNIDSLCRIADSAIDTFKVPFLVKGVEFHLGVSIGIAVYPHAGEEAETLVKNADLAMYQSKKAGKNRYNLFSKAFNDKARKRLSTEKYLRTFNCFQAQGDLFSKPLPAEDFDRLLASKLKA